MRNRVYTFVNILGLSLGICACIVIYTIIHYELSFDKFHPGKEQIYRVMGDVTESTGDKLHFRRLPLALLPNARAGTPGLDVIAGLIPYNAKVSIPNGDKYHTGTTVIAEPQYFDIFKYTWLAGDARTALAAPFTVVLTESKGRQYFGAVPPDKMIGKQVIYDDSLMVNVSGIVKDWEENTDLNFTEFISFPTIRSSFLKNNISLSSWGEGDLSTFIFVKLSGGTPPALVNSRMAGLVRTHADPKVKLVLWLEPLSDIHFNADVVENTIRTAHMPTLYGLMGVALFILLLAIINFINLSTAQSLRRAKEVGVRKVLGGSRASLVFQFLSETFLLTFFSILLAVCLVNPVLAAFRSFVPHGVSFHLLEISTLIFLVLVVFLTTVFAGLYPAKVLSSYLPALSLKGEGVQRGGEKWLLRKGLIVFQFAVSLVFIIGSIVIANQLRYTREKDLGFTADAIITVNAPRGDSLTKVALLAQKIKQLPGVNKVALQWVPPMTDNTRGMRLKFNSSDQRETGVTQVAGNEDFIPLYQMKLLAGRNLLPSDSVREFVINEKLCRSMGISDPQTAIGKTLYWNDKPFPVVGVVADFHTHSLHDPIAPLCIINRVEREGSLAIRLSSAGNQLRSTLSQIGRRWKEVYPSAPFSYQFYDESLALLYQKDQLTATLTNVSMAITIFISCIGLFGLALFTAEKRAKEISIRKVLGASITNIALLLSKDFVRLVVIALVIASPLAWYFMNRWLQSFAYRISIQWWVFLLAGTGAIFIALITTSFQAIKAAIANPIRNLRRE